jgi:PEP-CTERM/exosortase A-associated glycosyltransferase
MDGYGVRSQAIVTFQKEFGIEPVIVTSPLHGGDSGVEKENIEGLTYYRTHASRTWLSRLMLKRAFVREGVLIRVLYRRIKHILASEKIDLIHAHSPVLCGMAAHKAAREHGLPWVYEIRAFWEDAAVEQNKFLENSIKYKLSRALETYLCKKASVVAVISNSLKEEIKSRGIHESKIKLVPNGVDTQRFAPRPKDQEIINRHHLDNCTVVGFIGSFFRFEGLECLVEAMKSVVEKEPLARLLLVGDGIESDNIRRLIVARGMEEFVISVGRVPHEDVLKYYSVVDIAVYPRRRHRLTELVTPLKPLEALAMGKAVVGSNVGGIRELICLDGEVAAGMLFEADNPDDLACQLIRLIRDPDLREKTAKDARATVEKSRSWHSIAAKYCDVYQSAGVKQGRTSHPGTNGIHEAARLCH